MMTRKAFIKAMLHRCHMQEMTEKHPVVKTKYAHTVGVSQHCAAMVACSYITLWHTATKL
jgi:hypothetical protein